MMEKQTEDFKRELVSIFFAQKTIIFLTTLLIFICSVYIAFFWPPTYSATGSILLKGKKNIKNPDAIEQQEIRTQALTKEDLSSEVQILTSPDVIKRTIKYLKKRNLYPGSKDTVSLLAIIKKPIKSITNFLKDLNLLPIKKEAKTSLLDQEVYAITDNIKTKILPASNVIQINYYNNDPDDAVKVLSVLMDQYVAYRMQVFNPIEAESFFSKQTDKFRKGIEKKGEELMNLVEETRMSDPLKEIENNLLIKKTLEDELNVLENEAIEKRLFEKHLERTLNNEGIQFFTFLKDLPINGPAGLSVKLQELVLERGQTARVYSLGSENIKVIDKQINDTYGKLKSEVIAYKEDIFNQFQIAEEKILSIKNRLNSIDLRNVQLQRQFLQSQRIGNDVKLLLDSYGTFSKRKEEAQINSSGETANFFISILNKAFPSNGPVYPKPGLVLLLGIFVGFITGCSLGFIRDYFDHTFKDPGDISDFTGLPVVFSIPEWQGQGAKKFYTKKSLLILFVLTLATGTFRFWDTLSPTVYPGLKTLGLFINGRAGKIPSLKEISEASDGINTKEDKIPATLEEEKELPSPGTSALDQQHSVYSIQVLTTSNLKMAKKQIKKISHILSLPLRLEKIGSHYVIRSGLSENRATIASSLDIVKENGYPNAFIRKAYYLKERIISEMSPQNS